MLQAIAGAAWLTVVAIMVPGLFRLWRGRAVLRDVRAALIIFIALTQAGFSLRWLLFPRLIPAMGPVELQLWAALYVMSALGAAAIVFLFIFTPVFDE